MKKACAVLVTMAFFLPEGNGFASIMSFDIDGPGSGVKFTDYSEGISVFGKTILDGSSLSVKVATGLDDEKFTLADHQSSEWFDFLTFEVKGTTGVGSFDIASLMAFDSPIVESATAEGSGVWGSAQLSFSGSVAGGALFWNVNEITLTDSGGNSFLVTLQQGFTLGYGQTANLQAQITNLGSKSVPEPTTMLLIGTIMTGMVGVRRRKINK